MNFLICNIEEALILIKLLLILLQLCNLHQPIYYLLYKVLNKEVIHILSIILTFYHLFLSKHNCYNFFLITIKLYKWYFKKPLKDKEE